MVSARCVVQVEQARVQYQCALELAKQLDPPNLVRSHTECLSGRTLTTSTLHPHLTTLGPMPMPVAQELVGVARELSDNLGSFMPHAQAPQPQGSSTSFLQRYTLGPPCRLLRWAAGGENSHTHDGVEVSQGQGRRMGRRRERLG